MMMVMMVVMDADDDGDVVDRSIDRGRGESLCGSHANCIRNRAPNHMAKPEETSTSAPQAAYTQTPAEPVQEAPSFQRSLALVTNQPTTNKTAQRTDHCKLGHGALHTLSATDNQSCAAYKP